MERTLIQKFMPEFKMRQIDRVRVKAPPSQAWDIVRALDTQESFISKALFGMRNIPDKLFGKSGKSAPKRATIESFTGPGKGFQILGEETGKEVVIGSVGKFWKPNIEWAPVTPESFAAFEESGFGKLAWNLRVDPDSFGGSWISWDLRVTTTDDKTWRFFKRYWLVIGQFSHLLRRSALKSFVTKLGAVSDEEIKLAGDELVPSPKYQKTIGVTIEAPPEKVWPWLVQMGCRRGGWYSIDRLDNGGAPSAQQIVPEFQDIQVGQVLPWKPEGNDGFTVLEKIKNHSLVLGTAALLKGPHSEKSALDDTWAFFLEPIGPEATRLTTRVRAVFRNSWASMLLRAWAGPAHVIMESAQVHNLKNKIESYGGSSSVLVKEAPLAQFRANVSVDVHAAPEIILREFDSVTPREMPVARLLGEIRYLPVRLFKRKMPESKPDESFSKSLKESGTLVLTSTPTELVVCSAGKFHQITDQEFVQFKDIDEFREFSDPRYQKLFISVRAEPRSNGTTKLILEHWTWALSEKSRKQFARYWKVIKPTGNFVSKQLLKAAKRRAEHPEVGRQVPVV